MLIKPRGDGRRRFDWNSVRFFLKSPSFVRLSIRAVEPMAITSPGITDRVGAAFVPLTNVPALEFVSVISQPASRRISTAWSRLAVLSGSTMSQLRLRPIEFSQYSTGILTCVVISSSRMTGSSRRRPRRSDTKQRHSTTRDSTGISTRNANRMTVSAVPKNSMIWASKRIPLSLFQYACPLLPDDRKTEKKRSII